MGGGDAFGARSPIAPGAGNRQRSRTLDLDGRFVSAPPVRQTTKYACIDALRGYAVFMVLTCHAGRVFPELPFPLKKLTEFGWHGVQLFFLVSCVTLLLSWRSDEAKGRAYVTDFWLRRYFRIAPMYYLAALFYFIIEPPPGGFDLGQLLAAFTFVNTSHPLLVPTVPGRWTVVPGGWSIGVEFTFYAMFPLMAVLVRSLRRAVAFCVLALVLGCLANAITEHVLWAEYSGPALDNFLYFWFPNQLPVFALGTVLYYVLLRLRVNSDQPIPTLLRKYSTLILLLCVAVCVIVANLPFPGRLPFALPLIVPRLLVASLIFMIIAIVLANDPRSPFINRAICSLGEVSFSAYLLQFAVVFKLPWLFPRIFDLNATGWRAILACFMLWLAAVPITYALSLLTFRTIERPIIELGRRLLAARRFRLVTSRACG